MKIRTLTISNFLLFVLIVINICLRLGFIGNPYKLNWWPGGCPIMRKMDYIPIAYGDLIPDEKLDIIDGNEIATYDSTSVTHLILKPFTGMIVLKSIDKLDYFTSKLKNMGIRTIILLYKPYSIEVPEIGWQRALQWGQNRDFQLILDYTGNYLPLLRLLGCECSYHVIWNKLGIVKWAGRRKVIDIDFISLIDEVASGKR